MPAQPVLAGVVDVDGLDGVGEVHVHQARNPGCAIAQHDQTAGTVQAARLGLVVDAWSERLRILNRFARVSVVERASRTARSSASRAVCVKTQPSLTSGVHFGAPSVPGHPADAVAVTGMPVPSISM